MTSVIFIIDGIKKEDLEVINKYFPNLNKIINNSTNFQNIYTNGCPTEFAFPSILTSDWLLNNYHYNSSLKKKKLTAAEFFRKKKYVTSFFTPIYRPISTKLDRGFNFFFNPFCLRVFEKNVRLFSNWYLDEFIQGRIKLSFLKKRLFELYVESIQGLEQNKYHFFSYKKDIEKLKEDLSINKSIIFKNFLERRTLPILNFLNKNIKNFVLKEKNNFRTKLFYLYLAFFILIKSKFTAINTFRSFLSRAFNKKNQFSKFSSSNYLISNYLKWHCRQKQKTFSIIHLLDFHEQNYLNLETGKIEFSFIKKITQYFLFNKIENKKVHQILSLLYIDNELSKFFKLIDINNSDIILTSDHGNNMDNKTNFHHKTFDFSDYYYQIPLYHKSKNSSFSINKNLGSSIDIMPTLIWDMFKEEEKKFFGISLQNKSRKYLFFENTGRGPSDLNFKPVYLTLKKNNLKIKCIFNKITSKNNSFFITGELYDYEKNFKSQIDFKNINLIDIKILKNRIFEIYPGANYLKFYIGKKVKIYYKDSKNNVKSKG